MRRFGLCTKSFSWTGSVRIPLGITSNRHASTSAKNQIESAVKSLSSSFPTVDLTWKDGHISRFHTVWLIDHDPKFVHETSLQRNLDSAELPEEVAHPCEIDVADQGGKIIFKWDNLIFNTGKVFEDYVVQYDAAFLREHCYSHSPPLEYSTPAEPVPLLWSAKEMSKETIPKFCSENILEDDKELLAALKGLKQYGVILIDGMPSSSEDTEKIIRRIGPPRETFYGAMWDTAPKPGAEVNDTAYTKDPLHPHTDASYLFDMCGLQCFNCVAQSESNNDAENSKEGCTKLVDGFKIMEILKTNEPETYQFFLNTNLKWFCKESGVHMEMVDTAFSETPYKIFRYNNYDLDTVDYLPFDIVPEYYKHTRVINEYMRAEANIVLARLNVGEMVIVDNQRVCHGRTGFTGFRNMIGCYVGRDDWYSKLRVLTDRFNMA